MRRERLGEGVSAGGVVVSGNHLPNPLPPRVRRHSSTAQTPAKRVRRSTEHARGSRGWQCRLRGTPRPPDRGTAPGDRPRRTPVGDRAAPQSHPPQGDHRTESPRRPARPADRARHHRRPVRDRRGPPGGVQPPAEPAVLVAYGTSAGHADALTPGRAGRHRRLPHPAPPVRTRGRPPDRGGAQEQSYGGGRAPVKRLNPAHTTVCFQPTSHPCRFLGELADQPPCHQARRDHAVRFHPIGTGHERGAHFPARPGGGTLRDRMLPAKWPCRHSAGWSTWHDGTTRRSRFDLECRRLGTRARPRGNVQERQARKDQEDANTEGGLAS